MYWGIDGFLASSKTHKGDSLPGQNFLPSISAHRRKESLGRKAFLSSREKSVFSLSPSRVELFPGCSADMVLTASSDSPEVVQERLVCHGIVGHEHKHIMSVDVTCRFIAPVLSISSKRLNFYIEKVPGNSLMPLYEKLVLENVSPLSLSIELSLAEPFSLCEGPVDHSSATTKVHVEQAEVWVCFNPDYCQDRISRIMDEFLVIHYQGHPQQDVVELHAEVHFPNLHFSSTTVDFGCVLNCTETQRVITITNCSLLPVNYHWAFLEDNKHWIIRYIYTKNVHSPSYQLPVILIFTLSDCQRGIMIDGLESVYTQSAASTLQVVLKALKNLKHIYVVNLSNSYSAMNAQKRETEGKKFLEQVIQQEVKKHSKEICHINNMRASQRS
uniref:Hydin adenylate kinase-like domain-containing protein n=1 Tax=Monopterus albus TaxID=43700 RepID=A0A3Q3KEI6_MONAL